MHVFFFLARAPLVYSHNHALDLFALLLFPYSIPFSRLELNGHFVEAH
jgi:hypothetical protein